MANVHYDHKQLKWNLKQSTIPQVVPDYDVCHSIEDKVNVVRIRCAREMSVDFFDL